MPGLSCSTWDLFFFFFSSGTMQILSCGMWDLVPDQGLNQGPLDWEHGVLATGSPEKSLHFHFFI